LPSGGPLGLPHPDGDLVEDLIVKNISPARVLQRRAFETALIGWVLLMLGLVFVVIGLVLYAINLVGVTSDSYWLYNVLRALSVGVGGLMLLGGVGVLVRAFTWRNENDLAKLTAEALGIRLDDSFTFVRNVNKVRFYIDAVLVGLQGVLVFRLLDSEGKFINEGGNWISTTANGENVPLGFNPTQQAHADINSLKQFFSSKGMADVPIYGVVVFVKEPPLTQVTAIRPELAVAQLSNLVDVLLPSYFPQTRITPQQAQRLVNLLIEG
jgi:hypothetical protein